MFGHTMTFKKMDYNYIKIFLFFFLLSSCQTPKYSKVTNFSKSKNILPEVQYSISENFKSFASTPVKSENEFLKFFSII